jgi:metallophosphoesterase superfamily enzyme
MPFVTPSRRRLLQLAGATMITPVMLGMKRPEVAGRVLAISDMHSAYDRTAQLLAAFETEVRSNPVPHAIAINGDIFEHGNVVAQRSGGLVDWSLLAKLPRIAPTVVNLGNHDNDLTPDLAEVVTRWQFAPIITAFAVIAAGLFMRRSYAR